MKVIIFAAIAALLVSTAAAGIVAQCRSEFRNANCRACAESATQGDSTSGPRPCGWCPPEAAGGAGVCHQLQSGTTPPCADVKRGNNIDTCPAPSGGGGGSTTCDPAQSSSCSTPRECSAGELPVRGDPPACCPTCSPRCQSGITEPASPICSPNRPPMVNMTSCTLSCKRPPICDRSTALDSVPECSATLAPGIDVTTGCPRCRIPSNRDCSTATCAPSVCSTGTLPQPDASNFCCLTCRPRPPCNPATCASSFAELRVCGSGETPAFDETTCCPTCRIEDPSTDRPGTDGTCTADNIRKCMQRRPVCEPGQRPVFDPSKACCGSCRRPQVLCDLTSVAECATTVRDCASGEDPVLLSTSCCPSCRPAEPTCTTTCTDSEICIRPRDVNGEAQPFVCRAFDLRRFIVNSRNSTRADVLRRFKANNVRQIIFELVERYCDKAENNDVCEKYRTMVIRSTRCTRTSADGVAPVTLECKIPRAASTSTRSNDSPSAMVSSAVTSSDEYEVQAEGGSSTSAATRDSLSLAVASILIALSMLAACVEAL